MTAMRNAAAAPPARSLSARLLRVTRSLRGDTKGGVAVVFGLSLVPMILIVGLGVDYMGGLSNKRRLDAAADSAALAAIAGAQTYYNANVATEPDPGLTNDAVTAGQAQGKRAFSVNAGSGLLSVPATPIVTVTRSGQTFTAKVTYSGAMKTSFGGLAKVNSLNIGGNAGSTVTMGSYIDFHLMLDVSGSMGLPTSNAGQTALAAVNPDNKSSYPTGCVFACHFPGNQGYAVAKQNNITLRVDSVASAVNNLITTATNTETLTNQFRIGVYPFIVHLMQAAPISANFANATAVANNLAGTYLDTGLSNSATSSMGSGGTHFENVLPDIYQYVQGSGDGTSPSKAKTFLFLVTDGMDNNQTYTSSGWSGSQPREPNNFGYCQYAQSLGVTVSILYIPYVPIQNPNSSFAGNEDGVANGVVPSIPADLKACATPGFFFTANSNADINNAMQTMFAQALQAARLTQ